MAEEKSYTFTGTLQKVSSMSVQGGGIQLVLRTADIEGMDGILSQGMKVVEVELHFPKTYDGVISEDEDEADLFETDA